jgi:hypothetical protein
MKCRQPSTPRNTRKTPKATHTEPFEPALCRFAFADGRHCRMPRWKEHPAFCLTHAHQERQLLADLGGMAGNKRSLAANAARVTRELASLSGEFKTASDVNHVLGKLFSLLAQGRIPRRNAVALAYIGQLLIQTLPNVRREIKDTRGDHAWMDLLEAAYADVRPAEAEIAAEESDGGSEDESGNEPGNEPQDQF